MFNPVTMPEPTTMSDYHCNVQSIPQCCFNKLILYLSHKNPPRRVISEQTPAAFRRTPKGRQQAESRHSCKVYHIAVSKYHYRKLTPPAGVQSAGSAPQINPPAAHQLTSCHFYPVAGERRQPPKSRLTGFCSGAAGIRSTEYGYTQNLHTVKTESKIQLS